MVSYHKFRTPSNLNNETAYITTYDDFKDLEGVFSRVDKEKFFARTLNEDKVRAIEEFPIELGIPNNHELEKTKKYDSQEYFLEDEKVSIYNQLEKIEKEEVSIVIIGSVGKTISEMIASTTALRILYNKLLEVYKNVKMDIFLNASNNSFYSRDKSIYKRLDFISNIYPLSLSVKRFTSYDYFIDTSSYIKSIYFKELNYVDSWLYKFGFNYEKIEDSLKFNQLDISDLDIKKTLSEKIKTVKSKGKLLLYHPYSANLKKSIPQTYAIDLLKKLLSENEDYIIISALSIDSKIKDDRFLDLSKDSKSLTDFMYIVSQMDKVLTADTATFHISDAFMIPTVAVFTDENYSRKIKYYDFVKAIEVKDESKSLSKFIFDNEDLTIYKFESWKKLKVSRIIKLLDSF